MTTRITIPLCAIRRTRIGGVESSIYNMVRGLDTLGVEIGLAQTRDDYLADDFTRWIAAQKIDSIRLPTAGRRIAARFAEESLFGMRRTIGNVLYPNYFLPPVRRQTGRDAVVIQDSQHRVFPENFSSAKRRWLDFVYRHTLTHADRVFFISHFERAQAIRFFGGERADRYRVIGAAIDMARYHGEPTPRIVELARAPFILSVAHQHRHKNIATLVRAFAEFATTTDEVLLVLVGIASPEVRDTVAALPEAIQRRIVLTGFITDADLGHLYRETALFVLPSRYEGFGMPAVEALAHNRPALIADAGALREVTQNLATYVPDGAPPSQWAAALAMAIGGPGIGTERILELLAYHSPVAVARNIVAGFN